jgi:hypothetical protein
VAFSTLLAEKLGASNRRFSGPSCQVDLLPSWRYGADWERKMK